MPNFDSGATQVLLLLYPCNAVHPTLVGIPPSNEVTLYCLLCLNFRDVSRCEITDEDIPDLAGCFDNMGQGNIDFV